MRFFRRKTASLKTEEFRTSAISGASITTQCTSLKWWEEEINKVLLETGGSAATYQAAEAQKAQVNTLAKNHTTDEVKEAAYCLALELSKRGLQSLNWNWYPPVSFLLFNALLKKKLDWSFEEVEAAWRQVPLFVQQAKTKNQAGFILNSYVTLLTFLKPTECLLLKSYVDKAVEQLNFKKDIYCLIGTEDLLRRIRSLFPAIDGKIPDGLLQKDDFSKRLKISLESHLKNPNLGNVLLCFEAYPNSILPTKTWINKLSSMPDRSYTLQVAVFILKELLLHKDSTPNTEFLASTTTHILRASLWTVKEFNYEESLDILSKVGIYCSTSLSGGLCKSQPVASSAASALVSLNTMDVVPSLVQMQKRNKNKTLAKVLTASLEKVAMSKGLTKADLIEQTVPSFGLSSSGYLEKQIGDFTCVIKITGKKSELSFKKDSKVYKTVPLVIKNDYKSELKDLRDLLKEINEVLVNEANRLEGMFLAEKTWNLINWTKYYLKHPVTSPAAFALLWEIKQSTLATKNKLASDADCTTEASYVGFPVVENNTVKIRLLDDSMLTVKKDATISLWHPLFSSDLVRKWRDKIYSLQLKQPFKQAFREVYSITPAEEKTITYSNRFAGHILYYPQFGALLRARKWNGTHLGYWDGGMEGEAVLEFMDGTWRARFYYELVESSTDDYGTPTLCSTDQVRFEKLNTAVTRQTFERVAIKDVPSIIFSEIMRDVDLFVGVPSISSDPDWQDAGEERHNAYWKKESFSELGQSALLRSEALQWLLPMTKLASKTRVAGKFLEVEGKFHTYKIHLGSGNILMSPNDMYLCIVVDRGKDLAEVFLPFDGDRTLSIILSKAFLLAEDDMITDQSIVRQIKRV